MASSSKKPRMDQEIDVIDVCLTDFKEIAINFQNMLVDKTELIYIFRTVESKHVLITAPPKFGKSVNLTMFKCFFEIEVDPETGKKKTQFDLKTQAVTDTDNYHLFADLELAIMKHPEFVEKYLGRYPVLYVSFKCEGSIKTVDDAIEHCRTVVRSSFEQHKYLCVSEKLTVEDRALCKRWCSGDTYKKMDPSDALERLAKFLYEHFERDVVLLVDEYDSLVTRALVEADGNSLEDICKAYGVDHRVASALLKAYDCWKEQISQKHDITPVLVRALINASQQTREEICSANGVEINVAQQLVDEYEQQLTETWSISNLSSANTRRLIGAHENSIVEICKKPVDMMASLLKTDDKNTHLLGSLMTGVSYIAGIGWSGIVNNIIPYRFTQHHQFNQFYGFQLEEIEVLLEKLEKLSVLKMEKKEALAIIKAQYNCGHQYPGSAGNPGENIHCPWSVLNYLSEGYPRFFWIGSAYTEPLKHMFQNSEVHMFLVNILEKNGTEFLPTEGKLTTDDLFKLNKHMKGTVTEGSHHLFLNFIFELGFLTVESTQQQTENGCWVQIPNAEIRAMFLERLRLYYRTKL